MDHVTVTRGTASVPSHTLGACDALSDVLVPLLACFCTLYNSYMIPYYLPDQFVVTKSFGDVEI